MKIALLLLCHEPANRIVRRLSSPFYAGRDVKVYIHYDASRKPAHFAALRQALTEGLHGRVTWQLLEDRVHCAWGEFSLVDATHKLMQAALADTEFTADYLLLISASCVPIRPLASLQAFLRERAGTDFIQCVDISVRRWIKDGLEIERLKHYFPFNYRTQRSWFEAAMFVNRFLRIERELPTNFPVRFGSQWFALTRATAAAVAQSLTDEPLRRFLKHCWIPDEFAIQSLVARHQSAGQIASHNLTYYEFDQNGQPLVLDAGHLDHVLAQPFFFARKLQSAANALELQLAQHVSKPESDLGYFAHVGQPTGDYQRFLSRVSHSPKPRAVMGTPGSMLEKGRRQYLVLYGASRGYLQALMRAARAHSQTPMPLFDLVFDPGELRPAAECTSWLGVSPAQTAIRDYDPEAFLFQLAHIDAATPTAVAFTDGRDVDLRWRILNDENAIVMRVDPEGLSRVQLAEAALRDIDAQRDMALIDSTYWALGNWDRPLPQETFQTALREGKHRCHALQIQHINDGHTEPTLRAIRAAHQSIDAALYYAPEHVAKGRLFG